MIHDLKRFYLILLIPAVAGFIAVFITQHFHLVNWNFLKVPRALHLIVFIVSICFAAAFPILYRTIFAHKRRHDIHTEQEDWLKFERNLLCIAMTTPYVSLIAQILQLPRFHLAGTLIMAFYAVYYYYPSRRRLEFDRRIFRVKSSQTEMRYQ
jgi:MFS family permease